MTQNELFLLLNVRNESLRLIGACEMRIDTTAEMAVEELTTFTRELMGGEWDSKISVSHADIDEAALVEAWDRLKAAAIELAQVAMNHTHPYSEVPHSEISERTKELLSAYGRLRAVGLALY